MFNRKLPVGLFVSASSPDSDECYAVLSLRLELTADLGRQKRPLGIEAILVGLFGEIRLIK